MVRLRQKGRKKNKTYDTIAKSYYRKPGKSTVSIMCFRRFSLLRTAKALEKAFLGLSEK